MLSLLCIAEAFTGPALAPVRTSAYAHNHNLWQPRIRASMDEELDEADGARPKMDTTPLNPVARVQRALTFWSRVVPILGAYKAVEVATDISSRLPEPLRDVLASTGVPTSDLEAEAKYTLLHEWGSIRLEATIKELKGFYVKTGQVISTRIDLFPEQYTTRLASLQDDLDPMPAVEVRAIVQQELLGGEPLESIFRSFDDKPLGSASIAQVHAATLLDGRRVAVKVQRPNCEQKLLADIANLKSFSKKLASALPVDYYTVFCELERALQGELDFLQEGQAAMKVYASVSHYANGKPAPPSVVVPLPVQGLASRRVLVMDFVDGVPLNRLANTMKERGIEPGSPESKLAGRRILSQLSEAFSRMMLGAGFIHGDPHPGNIFVQEGGRVALIDCGQVKQISTEYRLQLAEAILLVNKWQETGGTPELVKTAQEKMAEFGVTFVDDAPPEASAALALLLFGDTDSKMPAGFSHDELSANSPIKQIASFPQELVLLGRATILIKGISKRLGIKWSLAEKWKPEAEAALACGVDGCLMPTWSNPTSTVAKGSVDSSSSATSLRFRDVMRSYADSSMMLAKWAGKKSSNMVGKVVPTAIKAPVKRSAVRIAARVLEK
ncbi:hypothetical protein AB1Y20_004822 [Prymnesium parvum]|uniref:Protein kinase domain-containing protein n=1 Tax=Prymnesium parvum TaxID=97485 RepID=A0AB34IY53_PRYPA